MQHVLPVGHRYRRLWAAYMASLAAAPAAEQRSGGWSVLPSGAVQFEDVGSRDRAFACFRDWAAHQQQWQHSDGALIAAHQPWATRHSKAYVGQRRIVESSWFLARPSILTAADATHLWFGEVTDILSHHGPGGGDATLFVQVIGRLGVHGQDGEGPGVGVRGRLVGRRPPLSTWVQRGRADRPRPVSARQRAGVECRRGRMPAASRHGDPHPDGRRRHAARIHDWTDATPAPESALCLRVCSSSHPPPAPGAGQLAPLRVARVVPRHAV